MSPRIEPCGYAVEATDYEQISLWREHHERVRWEQHYQGAFREIGTIDGRPVCVTVFWATIDGHRVAFYHATSQVVDHVMVDRWMRTELLAKGGTHSDAMNFSHVLDAIRRANAAEVQR